MVRDGGGVSELEALLLLQARAIGLPEPVTQFKFHPVRRWRFDLAWPDDKLAVEVDGATWAQGRHTRGKGYEGDCEKTNAAVVMGWRVLRFTRQQVESGYAVETIGKALETS